MIAVAVLTMAVTSTALAQVSYKRYFSSDRTRVLLVAALGLFALAQVGFFAALTRLDVGVVYMSTGITHVLVIGLSRFVLRERVTRHHLIAVALIAGGLVLYAS